MTFKWTSTLTALTGIMVLLAFVPGLFAWQRSDDKPGSPNDADFYWLLQSSIMQLLGIFTLCVPINQNEKIPSQIKWWTWLFVAIAATSTAAAVLLYVLVPVGYSSILTFVANCAQALVVLQLALASQLMVEKRKEKMA
ncbi:hypothetical protein F5884DRAFT_510209 [Xylogone sp. PMI_703]|nr:hypothetical protein F5884DRAFT_510209 [Xylogone sp. PMI_703]